MADQGLALYRAFLQGDQRALETLVTLYSDNLIRFAYLYVKDSAAAEDVAEDVFVALLLKRKPFEERAKFQTYLYTVARNKSLDYLRRHKKQIPLEDVESVLHTPCFESMLERKESYKTLYRCMNYLPEQYREVLHLTYFEGLSVAQICKITKQNTKQVYNLLSRAKHSLKELLKQQGVFSP